MKIVEQVEKLAREHAAMKFALSEIAKIAHYHKPLSDAAQQRIEQIATQAVQGATQ